MAHISASPPTAIIEDGDKSPPADLEEGEIEDGELPEEEVPEINGINPDPPVSEPVKTVENVQSLSKCDKVEKQDKSNETLSRSTRRKVAHHNIERNNDVEEEWACVVEKKLKAAMNKDTNDEKVNGYISATCDKLSMEEDKKNRRKKRKKKYKDDDDEGERKDTKKRKRNYNWDGEEGQDSCRDKTQHIEDDDDGDDDDDEMIFIRGASPIMKTAFGGEESPSTSFADKGFAFSQSSGFEEQYESFNEEESDFDTREDFGRCNPSDDDAPKRGMGRGVKRRQRAVGRLVPNSKRQTRKDTKSKRGGIKRQQPSRKGDRDNSVCMFWMQGKCQKGDGCSYSHNALPPRKLELCKFYLMDCCAKKEKCLYMHHDFPCKFFHTGLKCFSGPRCKFSHGHLSDTMRSILLKGTEGNRHNEQRMSNRPTVPSQEHRSKHLESAPKDLLGDFPRLSRDGAAAMVYNKKNRSNKSMKIPSLFDIEVPIPVQLLAEQKEAAKDQSPRRTPMPESDNEDLDGTTTPMPQSPVADSKSKGKSQQWGSEETGHSLQDSISSKDEKVDDGNTMDNKVLIPKFYQETDIEIANSEVDKEVRQQLTLQHFAGYSPKPAEERRGSSDLSSNEDKELKKREEDKKTQNDSANGDSGNESNDGVNIPLHLPKKQRELFLRIQQQQREAESSQDQADDQDNDIDTIQEENWYSSDEEEDSLTNVLKNLSQQEKQTSVPETSESGGTVTNNATSGSTNTGVPLKLPDLSKIDITESFTKLLSSIYRPNPTEEIIPATSGSSTKEQPPVPQKSVARDPRLARDPRRNQPSTPVTGNATVAFSTSVENITSNSSTTTTTSTSSTSVEPVRRSDPRRAHDPRSKSSHKNETQEQRHSGNVSSRRNSGSSSAIPHPSIYSNAIMGDACSTLSRGLTLGVSGSSTSGDIDLRNFLTTSLETGDVDLRHGSRTDTDLRTGQQPASLAFGDIDLRLRSHDAVGVGQLMDGSRGNSDIDLRRMLELPFKPVPLHTPATEIEASLTSHPPMPYKVVVVSIPRPDYTNLKLNTADPQVQSDPRLRKIFKLDCPGTEHSSRNLISNPVALAPCRNDPRRQSNRSGAAVSNSSSISGTSDKDRTSELYTSSSLTGLISKSASDVSATNSGSISMPNPGMRSPLIPQTNSPLLPNPRIPRDPRNAPGLLGPAPLPPNYCPNTPVYEEKSESMSSFDNDPRVMYSRNNIEIPRWEQQSQQAQQLQQQPRSNWRNNRRNQQPRYIEQDFNTPPM